MTCKWFYFKMRLDKILIFTKIVNKGIPNENEHHDFSNPIKV